MHAIHISQCVQWLLLRIGYLLWHALRNVSNSHRVMCLIFHQYYIYSTQQVRHMEKT